jgi:hypothetical protein
MLIILRRGIKNEMNEKEEEDKMEEEHDEEANDYKTKKKYAREAAGGYETKDKMKEDEMKKNMKEGKEKKG